LLKLLICRLNQTYPKIKGILAYETTSFFDYLTAT